jgi:hypothetical protein
LSDPNLYTGQEKRTPGYLRSPSTLRSGYPLELYRLCGEVNSEPIPPQQVRPEEDLLSWHKGGLCEEGLPIKGEIEHKTPYGRTLGTSELSSGTSSLCG